MKRSTLLLASIIAFSQLFFSCKKKENNDSTTTTTTTTGGSPAVNPLSSTVSGTAFSNAIWYSNVYRILTNKVGSDYYFSGSEGASSPRIEFKMPYGTGTYSIGQSSTCTAGYFGKYANGGDTLTNFDGISGTLNITLFDTNGAGSNYIKRIKGTFSFTTAINKGISHNVTNGNIDYTY